jgi:hypothetical protein
LQLRFRHAATLVASAFVFFASVAQAAPSACVQANQDAQDLRNKGQLREARAQLLVCANKSCNAVIRGDCEKWLKEVDEETPSIVVRVVDSRGQDVLGAKVTVDDARIELDGKPVSVDPGQRAIKARAKSGDVAETKVLVVQREKARVIEVKFPNELSPDGTRPEATPSGDGSNPPSHPPRGDSTPTTPPSRTIPITLGAIGGVAIVAFAFFEIAGQSAYSDLENGCGRTKSCTDNEIDPVKSKFVAAGVSLGVGILALGAAAVVYFTSKSSAPASSALRFSPVIRF